MGFTNFLGRKPPQKQDDISSFKSQAYGSTVESLAPVLGTNPIPGNGVNAIGSNGIHQLPRKKSRPQLHQLPTTGSTTSLRNGPASPAISISSAAPAPLVPRLRGSTLSRPNTAPDDPGLSSDPAFQSQPNPSGKSRSRRDSLRQSVAFLRKSGSQGDLRHPKTESSNGSTYPPPVPPIPAAHSPALTGIGKFPRSDTASLSLSTSLSLSDSLNRGPGFVDILDAQGEIRPGNFRSRVQAAGARDYGEDVAERNIALNGINLPGPSVSGYYATSTQSSTGPHSFDLDSLALRPRTVTYPKRVDSFDNAAAIEQKSMRLMKHRGSQNLDDNTFEDGQSYRHRSGAPSSSKHRPHPLRLQPIISNSSDSAAEPPVVPRTRAAVRSPQRRPVEDTSFASPRRARDSMLLTKQTSRLPSSREPNSPSLQVPSRPRTRDYGTYHQEKAAKHRSLHYDERRNGLGELLVESAADGGFASAAPAPSIYSFRSSDYPQIHMTKIDGLRSKSAHSGRGGNRARSNSRPTSSSSMPASSYPRTRSLGGMSLQGRPMLGDITEHIPPRTSSRRNWSISSSTPPASASDWSSDLFQRPHSRHTAETSIPPSASVKSLSLGNFRDFTSHPRADAGTLRYQDDNNSQRSPALNTEHLASEPTEGKGHEPVRKNWSPHDDEFGLHNTDSDYSSEQSRSQLQEESLLFREGGYGNGLPGLFEGRQSPTPSEWSVQTMTYDQALDLIAPGGLRPPNTPSTQKTTFRAGLPTLPSFDTSSNDGGSDATSESGLDAKMDAKMAMRVRRELKRRTRVANIEKMHGKQPMYAPGAAMHTGTTPTSHPQHV